MDQASAGAAADNLGQPKSGTMHRSQGTLSSPLRQVAAVVQYLEVYSQHRLGAAAAAHHAAGQPACIQAGLDQGHCRWPAHGGLRYAGRLKRAWCLIHSISPVSASTLRRGTLHEWRWRPWLWPRHGRARAASGACGSTLKEMSKRNFPAQKGSCRTLETALGHICTRGGDSSAQSAPVLALRHTSRG